MSQRNEEATKLMERCLDGVATPADIAALDRILVREESGAAARAVGRAAWFEGLLDQVVAVPLPLAMLAPGSCASPVTAARQCRGTANGRIRAVGLTLCAVAAAVGVFALSRAMFTGGSGQEAPPRDMGSAALVDSTPASVGQVVRLEDGSTASLKDDSVLGKTVATATLLAVELSHGEARFDVVPQRGRRFVVRAGAVDVEVIGTIFTVRRLPGDDRVQVSVERGLVKVTSGVAQRHLGAGETALFREVTSNETKRVSRSPPVRTGVPRLAAAPPSRVLAPEAAIRSGGNSASEATRVTDGVGALLERARLARLAGQPERAVVALRAAVDARPRDSRAAYAAFMLGRVLLNEMKRPREAAEAFATVRQVDPATPLAGDALAREIDCWLEAGDAARAKERGHLYLSLYPDTTRAETMRRLVNRE